MTPRSIVVLFSVLCLAMGVPAQAQLLPPLQSEFFNSAGTGPLASGFLCTTAAGSTVSQLTYQDQALTIPNQNPVRLNAAGRPVNGSTEVSVFLQSLGYRFSLYAAGTGNTCNGVTVGTLMRQVDNVPGVNSLLFTQGVITTNTQGLSGTATWSNAAVTFTMMDFTVTDTASNAASKFYEYFKGATSESSLRKDGLLNVNLGYQVAGTAVASTILISDGLGEYIGSTATYPNTTTVNQLLYSSAANTIRGLATANNAVLVTSAAGVPSLAATSANLSVSGSVLDTVQGIQTTSTPRFARIGLGAAADASILYYGTSSGTAAIGSFISAVGGGTAPSYVFNVESTSTGGGTTANSAYIRISHNNGNNSNTWFLGTGIAGTSNDSFVILKSDLTKRLEIDTGGVVTITSGLFNIPSGGSTTISTGVGSVRMSTVNAATNTAWIPIQYAGTQYYVPAWTTNAP